MLQTVLGEMDVQSICEICGVAVGLHRGIFQAWQEAPVNDSPKGGVKGLHHLVHHAVCHSQLSVCVYSCARVDRFAHA